MKKVIVTTTINAPTVAVKRFDSLHDWTLVVTGDKKTPSNYNLTNGIYLSPDDQDKFCPELSSLIGWNCIQRRNVSTLFALTELKADIVAFVDDDNIPKETWGITNFEEVVTDFFKSESHVFDPLSVTEHSHDLWHRGFPVQLLGKRKSKLSHTKLEKFDVQADLWDGDPDIDAICRLSHPKQYKFIERPTFSTVDRWSPFNSQNTFMTRRAASKFFMMLDVGRFDDIWASYYVESFGYRVRYGSPSVFQDRNSHDILRDLDNEVFGYKNTMKLIESLESSPDKIRDHLTPRAAKALDVFENLVEASSQR